MSLSKAGMADPILVLFAPVDGVSISVPELLRQKQPVLALQC